MPDYASMLEQLRDDNDRDPDGPYRDRTCDLEIKSPPGVVTARIGVWRGVA
jgi:hypothetical protein